MLDKARKISSFMVLRGILALIFGVLILALPPGVVIESFLLVFGVFAIVDGVFAIIGALASAESFDDWWLMLLVGIFSVMIGVFVFSHPYKAGMVIVMFVGFRAIIEGVLEIVYAMRVRKDIEGEWLLIIAGIISVVFGAIMVMFPIKGETLAGLTVVVWLIGIYAIAGGAMQLVLAGQMRSWINRLEDKKKALTAAKM